MNDTDRIAQIDITIRQLVDERRQLLLKLWKVDPAVVRQKIRDRLERQSAEAAFKQLTYTQFVHAWQTGWMPAIQITEEVILDDEAEFLECGYCCCGDPCAGHIYY